MVCFSILVLKPQVPLRMLFPGGQYDSLIGQITLANMKPVFPRSFLLPLRTSAVCSSPDLVLNGEETRRIAYCFALVSMCF